MTALLWMGVDMRRFWVDDDHVWRYDVDNPGPDDEPRAVGLLGDGWMLSDAIEIAANDGGDWCDCDACQDEANIAAAEAGTS